VAAEPMPYTAWPPGQQYITSELTNYSDQRFDESQLDQMNIASLVVLNNLYSTNSYGKKCSMQH
jgi:hypothetical protein